MALTEEQLAQNAQADKDLLNAFLAFGTALTGLSADEIMAQARQRAERSRRSAIAKNQRFAAALERLTDTQSLRITQQESRGYKFNKMWQNKHSLNVAVLLVNNNIFNPVKGRIGTKLMVVYPDGTSTETFEKTVTLKHNF
jgi:hypothetical protein